MVNVSSLIQRPLMRTAVLAAVALFALVASATTEADGSLIGRLLVAKPEMADPRFRQTVIYMVRHDPNGAMGLVVNRPLGETPLAQLLRQLGLESEGVGGSIRVHWGGPVEGRRGFVLHTPEYTSQGTLVVNGAIALTEHRDIFRALAAGTGPRRSMFTLGYAGWAPGQLEREMERGDWITVTADPDLIFDADPSGKWQRARALEVIRL